MKYTVYVTANLWHTDCTTAQNRGFVWQGSNECESE
uniref:Uncharacterized protein n=1 Tax=Anguilla anguilla TaxID=7936 RepID=A0A0E9SXB8_ANGAN